MMVWFKNVRSNKSLNCLPDNFISQKMEEATMGSPLLDDEMEVLGSLRGSDRVLRKYGAF